VDDAHREAGLAGYGLGLELDAEVDLLLQRHERLPKKGRCAWTCGGHFVRMPGSRTLPRRRRLSLRASLSLSLRCIWAYQGHV
jgi:hypothetical protein